MTLLFRVAAAGAHETEPRPYLDVACPSLHARLRVRAEIRDLRGTAVVEYYSR